jgi:hypothetical protein
VHDVECFSIAHAPESEAGLKVQRGYFWTAKLELWKVTQSHVCDVFIDLNQDILSTEGANLRVPHILDR